jgi:hypothetical protein
MQRRGWLLHGRRDGLAYEITASGIRALLGRGVDIEAARALRCRFTAACLDWTERAPHLGGALGAAILDALLAAGYVRRRPKRRDLRIVNHSDGGLLFGEAEISPAMTSDECETGECLRRLAVFATDRASTSALGGSGESLK